MKTAKLVRRGAIQAVRLPLEFQFEGTEVLIKRDGIAITLLPRGSRSVTPCVTYLDSKDISLMFLGRGQHVRGNGGNAPDTEPAADVARDVAFRASSSTSGFVHPRVRH